MKLIDLIQFKKIDKDYETELIATLNVKTSINVSKQFSCSDQVFAQVEKQLAHRIHSILYKNIFDLLHRILINYSKHYFTSALIAAISTDINDIESKINKMDIDIET